MKSASIFASCLFLACATAAMADDAGNASVNAAINKFAVAFNKGDMKAAKALHTAAPVIVDEVPPHIWNGPNAFDNWGADLARSEAAEGKSGGQVMIGAPTREEISGEHAYVIAPSTYTFKQKGKAMRETAQITFVLAKDAGGWKIASWTWTGPQAKPLK